MNRRIVAVNLARTCEPFPLPIALTSGVAPPSIAPPPSHLPIRGQPTIPYNIISSSLQFLSAEISPISEPTISSNLSRCVLTSRVPRFTIIGLLLRNRLLVETGEPLPLLLPAHCVTRWSSDSSDQHFSSRKKKRKMDQRFFHSLFVL